MEVGPLRIEYRATGGVGQVVRQAKSYDEAAGESHALGFGQSGGDVVCRVARNPEPTDNVGHVPVINVVFS